MGKNLVSILLVSMMTIGLVGCKNKIEPGSIDVFDEG